MAIVLPAMKKARRHRNCDAHPTKFEIDPSFGVPDPYSCIVKEPGDGGLARNIGSFTTAATAAANFIGVAEDKAFQDPDGSGRLWLMVHKCFEMDVDIIDSPTIALLESTWDPITNPLYVHPWVNADTEVEDHIFDISETATNTIGVVKQICQAGRPGERKICPDDIPAANNTSGNTAVDTCAYAVVRVRFISKLPEGF